MDKLIWIWLNGNSAKGLKLKGTRLNPSRSLAIWNWIFDRSVAGRPERALKALRLRSLAYRRAGLSLALCSETALADLAEALPLVTLPLHPAKPAQSGPPARKAMQCA
jgi:hypothetical protein